MASLIASRPRPRPAHTQGITRCAYTPDGTRLVTVGSNNTIRLYKTGFDGEPTNIDECQEQNLAVAATNDFFVAGSEDGTVSYYALGDTNMFDRFLLRTSLPVRDVAISPDNKWCAVASDELTVKLVGIEDNTKLLTLKEHGKPTKHLSFDPRGSMLALSCTDGVVYIYSLTAEHPELIRKVDGVIGRMETESEASCRVVWHPDGRAFAVATPTRDIQVVSKNDWEKQRAFSSGHDGDITALAWSPNGALLASAGKDKKLLVWSAKDQSVVARYEYPNVIDIAWHPTKNLASFTTSDGEVFICPDFVTEQFASMLQLPRQPAPFIHDPLAEIGANGRRPEAIQKALPSRPRAGELDDFDDLMDDNFGEDDDGFVVDDDGAGYTLSAARKRSADDDLFGQPPSKRGNFFQPELHPAFQPGSTPWRGNRKYLCLNLIGFVWTVDQDSHNTVTVEFYDHEFHRDFHFTDTFLYDKACLNEKGTLFSCPPKDDAPAVVFYRPHETWTQRSDWRIQLPKGEAVLAMSLSDTFITVTTTGNYVRIYTLFGIPYRVYRPKSTPIVTCASWRDYVLTMGNGPVGPDGMCRLLYSIENIKRDEMCQNEDTVALPEGATVKSVFFSDNGDPCIYDSTGTLLTLLHWRQPSRASWIPLLDTKLLPRLASGRKHESYFPIAVADDKFHCIILKGGDQYPYFPRPLLSEFDFSIPLTSVPKKKSKPKSKKKPTPGLDLDASDDDMLSASSESESEDNAPNSEQSCETLDLTQTYLQKSLLHSQLSDLLSSSRSTTASQRALLARLELDIDKTLLQMLAVECREGGEERGMRALEVVQLMRDHSGRMIEAAGKIAERYGRAVLREKIREVGEARLRGDDEEEEDDGFD
ncbi:hypothetical protein VTI74DRAFT_5245 [Chaetomium olivicolor]